MIIDLQPSEEIKSRLDIVDIIREYIQLRPAGVNFRALCPFHQEKSPSFVVSPEKQIWHCFGCGKGGDVISFVKEIEGLDFIETLRVLAPKAGVVLKRENPTIASQRNRLMDILEISVKYYNRVLAESPLAAEARDYLKERGLNEKTIEDWRIGFAPDSWDDLTNYLKNHNYNDNEIFLAGMSSKKEGSSRFYNRFRNRIMFPIADTNSSVVGFTARVMPSREKEEKMGKYINSPQTLVYDKSRVLFGLDKAKMNIKATSQAIVVEGQMDVITAHQAGYKNIIASSGTALTLEQLNLIKRYSDKIYFAFDADAAGQMAADRGIREAMRLDLNIKVIEVPKGKDPDECIRQYPREWEAAVKSAKPFMQYFFDKTFLNLDVDNIEHKRRAAQKILPLVTSLANPIDREHWFRLLSEAIKISEKSLREAVLGLDKKPIYQNLKKNPPDLAVELPKPSREMTLSDLFLAIIMKFPALINYALSRLEPDNLPGETNKTVYNYLIIYYNNIIENSSGETVDFDYKHFRDWLICEDVFKEEEARESMDKQLVRLALLGDRDYYQYSFDDAKKELIKIIIYLKKLLIGLRKKEIEKEIGRAELQKSGDFDSLLAELKSLTEEERSLEEGVK